MIGGMDVRPLLGKKVAVDAGHGGDDSGTHGATGLLEKDVNLDIATRLRDDLQALGAEVVMTRTDDTFVSLQGRCDIANEAHADVFVSVHNNSFTRPEKSGTEAYQSREASDQSRLLTRDIYKHLESDLPTEGSGIRSAGFYVLRHTTMPAVLTEIAYMSNAGDEALLATPAFREQAAQAIADGVTDYFQNVATLGPSTPLPYPVERFEHCPPGERGQCPVGEVK